MIRRALLVAAFGAAYLAAVAFFLGTAGPEPAADPHRSVTR